jgi:hypothetical protein
MSDSNEVPIDVLLDISNDLRETFFKSHDIYALLVLSIVTVTNFSRTKHRLSTETRIDISIEFIPELIPYLARKKIITKTRAANLMEDYTALKESSQLPYIFRAYIYAAGGLRTNLLKHSKKSKIRRMLRL